MLQATQVFADWATQTIRLYEDEEFIEVTYTVGPIPFHDGKGKEIVSVWQTGLADVCLCLHLIRHWCGFCRLAGEFDMVYGCKRT